MAGRVLDVRALRWSYGLLQVLDGVDLTIHEGEIVGLVGENGTGKSTLVRCIAGDVVPTDGTINLDGSPLGGSPTRVASQGVSVVWQDLALCDNLDVSANLFLGREAGRLLWSEHVLHARSRELLAMVGMSFDDVRRPVGMLSGGQRQSVAMARALLEDPRLLVLDEPMAALGVHETRTVERVIRDVQSRGSGVLLISHDLEQVFSLADRIAVLRGGRIVADTTPRESHPDDVIAMMAGAEVDTTARRQLRRLRSLVDQLEQVDPAVSLPLIVSTMATALEQDRLCVHLVDESDPGRLRRSAAIGLPPRMLEANATLPVGPGGGSVGRAAATGRVVVVEDVAHDPMWTPYRHAAIASGVGSAWAAPIVGSNGEALGTVSGYGTKVGRPSPEQLELISLYANHAAAAIERERLLREVTRRNQVLEGLRGVLEALAGPDRVRSGVVASLEALRSALSAARVSIVDHDQHVVAVAGADDVAATGRRVDVALQLPDDRAGSLTTVWPPGVASPGTVELLRDAARSLQLALEGEALADARREADALRRSHRLQRELLQRLSHELRTPLTAVHGYATTLLQTDVTWDAQAEAGFLGAIATESERLGRLVTDLLDSSAIESGLLRLTPDWCDAALVAAAAIDGVDARGRSVRLRAAEELPPVWADHDRLQQVLVNLIDNALRHTNPNTEVEVDVDVVDATLVLRVRDDGPGIPASLSDQIFDPHVRGDERNGAGLGLTIARGIARAHGGSLELETADVGTCFRVEIPVEVTDDDRAELWWEVLGRA